MLQNGSCGFLVGEIYHTAASKEKNSRVFALSSQHGDFHLADTSLNHCVFSWSMWRSSKHSGRLRHRSTYFLVLLLVLLFSHSVMSGSLHKPLGCSVLQGCLRDGILACKYDQWQCLWYWEQFQKAEGSEARCRGRFVVKLKHLVHEKVV